MITSWQSQKNHHTLWLLQILNSNIRFSNNSDLQPTIEQFTKEYFTTDYIIP